MPQGSAQNPTANRISPLKKNCRRFDSGMPLSAVKLLGDIHQDM
ncbi:MULTISPECIES: hypothetical protein [unclassified Rhizobium]|nr:MULTISPECIES: hypothetical protein [unclassified Rhizobium]